VVNAMTKNFEEEFSGEAKMINQIRSAGTEMRKDRSKIIAANFSMLSQELNSRKDMNLVMLHSIICAL
jgi:hypothetical protein